jgi:cell division protein ZapA (FtsZ GTPase activity inhibitor)
MSVIPLFSPRDLSADWSQKELAELYRVEDTLIQAGISVETERGLTEEGDPWFVFCRQETGEVIIHFARCDGLYLAVGSFFEGVLRGNSFSAIVRQFLENQPLLLTRRRGNNDSNLFMHPSAMLMALVTTAFLVSQEVDPSYSTNPAGKEDLLKGDSLLMRVAQAVRASYLDVKFSANDFTGTAGNVAPAVLLAALLVVEDSQTAKQEIADKNSSLEVANAPQSDNQVSAANREKQALINAQNEDNSASEIDSSIMANTFEDNTNPAATAAPKTVAISDFIELAENTMLPQSSLSEEAENQTAPSATESDVSAIDGVDDAVISVDSPFTPEGTYRVITAYNVNYAENALNTYDLTAIREFNEISAELNLYLKDPVEITYAVVDRDILDGNYLGIALDSVIEASPTPVPLLDEVDLARAYDAIADTFVKQFIASATDLQVLLYGSSLILVDNDQITNANEFLTVYSWDFQDGSSISIIGIVPDEMAQMIA